MPISFIESPRFPDEVAAWALGGPQFKTDIAEAVSGDEKRNIVWTYPRCRWNIGAGLREIKDAQATIAFHRNTYGRALGFRFRDPFDNAADHTSGVLGTTGLGTGLPAYQLYKNYLVGSQAANRKIVKPVIGSIAVKRGGVLQVQGVAAGNYAVDYTTGIATFVADATSGASSITVGATTQVQLAGAIAGLGIGGLLYLSGFTGADAALVNGLAHTISGVSGSTYTLATNTAGKAVTLGAGAGAKYPQASETLTWSGSFDVAARFDNDELDLQLDEGGLLQFNNIIVRELRL
jgi:uncharacterized protein (TIGR02217 family)